MNKKIAVLGIIGFLLLGAVFVLAAETANKEIGFNWFGKHWLGHKFHAGLGEKETFLTSVKEKLGLPNDATNEQVKEALKQKMAERRAEFEKKIRYNLGLPEDATQEQVREALKQKWEKEHVELTKSVKEKLGLPQDASEEEFQSALNTWRKENKDLLRMNHHKFFNGFRGGVQ